MPSRGRDRVCYCCKILPDRMRCGAAEAVKASPGRPDPADFADLLSCHQREQVGRLRGLIGSESEEVLRGCGGVSVSLLGCPIYIPALDACHLGPRWVENCEAECVAILIIREVLGGDVEPGVGALLWDGKLAHFASGGLYRLGRLG
jgi:hypothetical protein